jgi:two-component system, sensor histidine kinase PdtaS
LGLLRQIRDIGIEDHHSPYDKKLRRFFNLMNLFGGLSAIPQIVMAYPDDKLSALFHGIWASFAFIAILAHAKLGFKIARFITFCTVLLFGHMASMRVGPDALPHIASFGVMVACFFMHDIRKEWGYLIFFVLLEVAGIIFIELRTFQVSYTNPDTLIANRIIIVVGTMIFVLAETVYFVHLSNSNEQSYVQNLLKTNKDLTSTNQEKNVLLREVHHRVKNNLQLISSLLRIQAEKSNNVDVQTHFIDATNRIKSISLLHEKVYQNESFAKIDLKEYVDSIGEEMVTSLCPEKNIKFNIESELIEVQNDSLVPLALIFNELVSNSLKHGLSNVESAEIQISIQSTGKGSYVLEYKDGGQWVEPSNNDTFGMELIQSLSEQLSGGFELNINDNSPEFKITFSLLI